jgi:aminoglycoside phosphotransferase (APT) family kinase protein
MTGAQDARPVRSEDGFDVEAVADWLRTHADDPTGLDGTPEVRQFSGGASNLTFLLSFPATGTGPGPGRGRDLVVRRAPHGTKAAGAHDMSREYRLQSALAPYFTYVPAMVAFCTDTDVMGAEFYAMELLRGLIPRSEWPKETPLSPEQARELCLRAVDVLAELHSVDPEIAGLSGKGEGYVRRQVEGWTTRYRNARTDDVPDCENVMTWLAANQPDDVATCVIHNDFKLDNLVLDEDDPTVVVGVLDWELATIGDPLMDLACSMAYWVQADDPADFQMVRRVPTHLPGMLTRDEFVAAYSERTGLEVSPQQWRFYEVYGLFRLAGIAQQIYYRYFHGQTSNEMYAIFGPAVRIVAQRLDDLIGVP